MLVSDVSKVPVTEFPARVVPTDEVAWLLDVTVRVWFVSVPEEGLVRQWLCRAGRAGAPRMRRPQSRR